MGSDAASSELDPVEAIVEEYLGSRRRGDRPTAAEYAVRYPEHAARILKLFPALELIEGLKATPEDDAGPSGDPVLPIGPTGQGVRLQRLGDYALLRELGRGGMGIVYEAMRESLKNRVALKVMHARFRADRVYVRRFQTEARSAAKLHHTNIVPVFDYGEQDGICYYAMQYIDGVGLDRVIQDVRHLRDPSAAVPTAPEVADEARSIDTEATTISVVCRCLVAGRYGLAPTDEAIGPIRPPSNPDAATGGSGVGPSDEAISRSIAGQAEPAYFREVARLGAQVADALEHAHRQGVVHRDIKPSNLLLDARGNVWVTDFGLAKLMEGGELSQSHDLVGTMRFMAPERFRSVTDHRGDVYALGATLYELLTLRPAFAALDQARMLDQIAHVPPRPLREHDPRIHRDLETLVLKALAKDPKDRFATAGELGEELWRFLESRPIRSRPIPALERFGRWCCRNPGLAGASIAAATLTTLLAIGSTIAARTYSYQRDQISGALVKARNSEAGAIEARTEAKAQLFEALKASARAGRFSRQMGQRFGSLEALTKAVAIGRELRLAPDRIDSLRDEATACLALPDMKETGRVIRHPRRALLTAFDPAMTRYALRFAERVEVRRVSDDVEVARFPVRGDHNISLLDFSPDGHYLATTHSPGFDLTIWDIDRRTVTASDPGPVGGAAFSPDSRRFAIGHPDGQVVIYDLATGRPGRRWRGPARVDALAFRPDGMQVAGVYGNSKNPVCRILESDTGRIVRSFTLPAWGSVAWSPDGTTLATGCDDSKIYVWDAVTGTRRAVLEGSVNIGLVVTFHPSGTLLASNGWEARLRLWDAVSGRPMFSLTGRPRQDGFSRDGRIVVAQEDRMTIYQVDPALEYRTFVHLLSDPFGYQRSSIRHDGRILAVSTNQGLVLWDLARGVELAFLRIGNLEQPIFEASGDLITSGSLGVQRWPIRLGARRGGNRIGPPTQLISKAGVGTIAEDRRGQIVAVAYHDHAVVTTPDRTIRVGPLDDCRDVAVSPDGRWLVTGSHHMGAQVWQIRDASMVADLPIDYGTKVFFSPDGKWLMTAASPCRLWDVGTWSEAGQTIGGTGLSFSPDGRLLVVQDASKVLRLVETESGRTVARFESPDLCSVEWATFSPDGSRLVVNTPDGPAVHVWDLRAIRHQLVAMGLDWDTPAYSDDDPADQALPPLPPLQVDLGQPSG